MRPYGIGLYLGEDISLGSTEGTSEVIDGEALRVGDEGLEGSQRIVGRPDIEREVTVA